MSSSHAITTIDELLALYGAIPDRSLAKETHQLTAAYRKWIEQAPFFAIASSGPNGLDCSPRGDAAEQLLRVIDETTIAIPDRRGNNRLDTLRNIIADPRIGLLFLIPGIDETLRINGRATITTDPDLIDSFAVGEKKPASIVLVEIDSVYFQCARALMRAGLWKSEARAERNDVPTVGKMLKSAMADLDAEAYDLAKPAELKVTLY